MQESMKIKIDKGVKKFGEMADWLKKNIDDIGDIIYSSESDFSLASVENPIMVRVVPNSNDSRDRIEKGFRKALAKFSTQEPDVEFENDSVQIQIPKEMKPFTEAMVKFLKEHDDASEKQILAELSKFRVEIRDLVNDNSDEVKALKEQLASYENQMSEISTKVNFVHVLMEGMQKVMAKENK